MQVKKGSRRRKVIIAYVKCARTECGVLFGKTVHNQKYHSPECCQIETNAKLLAKYHERKKPIPVGRICSTRGCKTILSVYNRDKNCSSCQYKQEELLLSRV